MANFISNVSEGLIFIGRNFLRNLTSRNILLRRVNTTYLDGWSYGQTFQIPQLDISGGAAIRLIGGAATADDIVALTQTFTKQQIYKAVKIENLQMLWASEQLMAKVGERLAYKVGKKGDSIVAGLHTQIPYEVGTLNGDSCWDPTATSDPFKPLNDALVLIAQNDGDTDNLTAVFNPYESGQIRRLPNILQAQQSGSTNALRTGEAGNILGFEVLMSQQIQNATLTTAAITASPAAVNNAAGYPINTTTMAIDGVGAGTIPAGSTFTIAGVTNDESNTRGFVVNADALIAGNAATIVFNPPLPVAIADNAVITFKEHSAAGSMNLAFHRDAIAVAIQGMAPFMPGTGVAVENVTDEQTGLSVQIAMKSNLLGAAGTAYTTEIAASVIFGAGVVMPELAVKITGHV